MTGSCFKNIARAARKPDRSPAVGAEVALITIEHSVTLAATRFQRPLVDTLLIKTDAHGHFSFSPDAKAHTVAVASKDGYARVRVRDARQPLGIVLQPWGRIEGQIDPAVRALPIASVALSDLHVEPDPGSLRLAFDYVRPDGEGRFVLDDVPAETVLLHLNPGDGRLFHHRTPVTVAAGQATRVVITNNCWRAKGRFILAGGQDPESLKQVRAYFETADFAIRPPEGLSGDAVKFWWVDFWDSPTGIERAIHGLSASITTAADGSFETEGRLPPGNYRLRAHVPGGKSLDLRITLEAPTQGAEEMYNLGIVEISMY